MEKQTLKITGVIQINMDEFLTIASITQEKLQITKPTSVMLAAHWNWKPRTYAKFTCSSKGWKNPFQVAQVFWELRGNPVYLRVIGSSPRCLYMFTHGETRWTWLVSRTFWYCWVGYSLRLTHSLKNGMVSLFRSTAPFKPVFNELSFMIV